MKLRTALNTIIDTKILITGQYGTKYADVYIKQDYLGEFSDFCAARRAIEKLLKENPKVLQIGYNHAVECIEIRIAE